MFQCYKFMHLKCIKTILIVVNEGELDFYVRLCVLQHFRITTFYINVWACTETQDRSYDMMVYNDKLKPY